MTMGTILLLSLQLYVKEPSLRLLQGCIAPPLFNLLSVLYSDCPSVQRHRKLTDPVDRIPMACPGEHQIHSKTTELPLQSGGFKLVTHRDMGSRPPCRASRYSFQQEASNELMSPYSLLLVVVLSAANVERIEQ